MIEHPFTLPLPEVLKTLEQDKAVTLVNVGNLAAKAFLVSELAHQTQFSNIFWASNDDRADEIEPAVNLFFPETVVTIPAEFKWRDFYRFQSAIKDKKQYLFLFEDFKGFSEKSFPTDDKLKALASELKVGQSVPIYEFFEKLQRQGYQTAEDKLIRRGEFVRRGDSLFIYPIDADTAYRIELFGNEIEQIETYPQGIDAQKQKLKSCKHLSILPVEIKETDGLVPFEKWLDGTQEIIFIADDLDEDRQVKLPEAHEVKFTTFPKNEETFYHLNFFSVLPFYTLSDFVVELKERMRREFTVVVMTKKREAMENIFREHEIMSTETAELFPSTVNLIEAKSDDYLPHSFQNNDRKLLFLTDREIFQFKRSSRQKKAISGMNLDLINSLKPGDFVVHLDHGIAEFEGMQKRETIDGVREYLKLAYAGSDRLFVPVESAEKVSKYVGQDEPRCTKLGGAEWQTMQRKIKAETEKIAKELLQLYAKREMSKGEVYAAADDMMDDFCASFPYELTPGQKQSWEDVRMDLERPKPMDRLVCGDVGFGKTEIAMRTAFKAFRSGKQCAILAPITILAEQHYQGFLKRIEGKNYGIRVALMSRFQSSAEQKKILKDLQLGLIDVVIGTHRLLSGDVKFADLGLLIIDEEQRFGVKQKEKLKELRANVDILTLTATPIPRTLHMGLSKLKDVSTITTPPPGRLPVVSEVRRYNLNLIRERILLELERGGQVYFLHNQVKTIESQAAQMRELIPEAKFIVAHGQLSPHELEDRIRQFKDGEADVLIASTIIENGIDLPNANTLFVNRADKFGLSQLYQLRGRVGRGRTQAYAFFLYQGQKLELDAKKRLRAIVEASELGAGFQIAMKDLEIRGAGEILGASQSGAMKDTGVSHFMRMLQKTVEEIKSGNVSVETAEEENVTVEIPLSAYIPPSFIPSADEKIQVYQELASAGSSEALQELRKDLREDYGTLPKEVDNLCKVIELKLALKAANLSAVRVQKLSHKAYEMTIRMGQNFTPDQVFPLLQKGDKDWTITANALKLKLDLLPVTWYEELLADVQCMKKVEVKEKKKKNK